MFEVLLVRDHERWNRVLDQLPSELQDVHFTPEWGAAHEDDFTTAKLAVLRDERRGHVTCQAFLHRAIPGSPFSDMTAAGYGGPVTSAPLPAFTDGQAFENAMRPWRDAMDVISEFYLLNPVLAQAQAILLPTTAARHLERGVSLLPLKEDLTFNLRPNRRQSLAKAVGATVAPTDPLHFRALYQAAMERKGAPRRWQFPPSYFGALDRAGCAIVGATDETYRMRAVALFSFGRRVAYYHLSALSREPLDGYADRLILEGCHLAWARGCEWLHLGGGLTDDDGLAAYKRSFGGIIRPVYSMRRVHDKNAYEALGGRELSTGYFPAYRAKEAA